MIVPTDEAFSMTMAALRRGAVVVIPTDTVYGLAARADDAFVRRLALEVGPIAASSANESGAPTPATAREIAELFPSVSLVVDGGPRKGVASTVIDATVDPPVLLRAGALPPSVLGI